MQLRAPPVYAFITTSRRRIRIGFQAIVEFRKLGGWRRVVCSVAPSLTHWNNRLNGIAPDTCERILPVAILGRHFLRHDRRRRTDVRPDVIPIVLWHHD